MSEPSAPEWAVKRDGRRVPFEADKISRALFAASDSAGRPDAFLARELADGVVHFLAQESEASDPTTEQIEEVVVKVVRELGHPALAATYATFAQQRTHKPRPQPNEAAPATTGREVVLRFEARAPIATVLAQCARAYALEAVFTRDLVAAHNDGLIVLAGLEAPGELAGCVLAPPAPGNDWLGALEEARGVAGEFVALDGPEYALGDDGPAPRELARALAAGRLAGLRLVVNLNTIAPSWAGDLALGPLFTGRATGPTELTARADALLEELLAARLGKGRIDWHLAEHDFAPAAAERLARVVQQALAGRAIGFVFDRPRRPVALAEGLDRRSPAVLLRVGLNLLGLARQSDKRDPAHFLHRLGSLARLALSAAVQKRDYLRRAGAPTVTSGFLLDRARLVVAPLSLDEVVAHFTQRGVAQGGAGLELGRQVVLRLRDVLRQDGRMAQMDTCIDGPFDFGGEGAVAGLTPWDASAHVKGQLRAGGALHAVAEHGTLALFLPEGLAAVEQVAAWLREAWERTEVVRVRLFAAARP